MEWPAWKRRLVATPPLVLGLTVIFGLPIYATWQALSYEPGTAHVERCREEPTNLRKGPDTTLVCYGTWRTESGQRGSGPIGGTDTSDVGTELRVWVAGDSATATYPWWWWLFAGFGVAMVLGFVGALVWAIVSARRHGDAFKPAVPRNWDIPDAFDPRGRPALYAAPQVVVTWETGMTEVRYEFVTRDGRLLAKGEEADVSLAARARRSLGHGPGPARIRLTCRAEDGTTMFTLDKPAGYVAGPKSVTVLGPRGEVVGSVVSLSRNPFKQRYTLRDAHGRELVQLWQPRRWMARTFLVVDGSGYEVARLADPLDERLFAKHPYLLVLQFRFQPPEPLHTLLLAAVPGINLLSGAHTK